MSGGKDGNFPFSLLPRLTFIQVKTDYQNKYIQCPMLL